MTEKPSVILRIGSHAEKEYFENLAKNLDAIMFGGNLLEITPAATSSFLFALKAKRAGRSIPFFLDPITYCFGKYIDPSTGKSRGDLDALKADKLVKRGGKARHRIVKDSYLGLAAQMGGTFQSAVADGVKCRAVDPASMSSAELDAMCEGVISYQWNRVAEILSQDELMAEFVDEARPSAVFAPYFFVAHDWAQEGLDIAVELARRTAAADHKTPVHAIFCGSASLLGSEAYIAKIIEGFGRAKIDAVWLWFDGFDELSASSDYLRRFRTLVSGLAAYCGVYNLHGGYFSLLLAHHGMRGISHGVGYGERKQVQQVIGPAAPTVRYYLPPIWMRVGIPEVQLALHHLGIETKEQFFDQVCSCQICKGVLRGGIDNLSAFGEVHKASVSAMRHSQTPAAAKMCRYHFLLNRLKEPKIVAALDSEDIVGHLRESADGWLDCVSLEKFFGGSGDGGYVARWIDALRPD